MKRSLLNAFAAIGLAIALSGCVIAPWHHRDGGYGGDHRPGSGYYHNGY